MRHPTLYIGSVVPPEDVQALTAASVAGNRYQWGFLSALGPYVGDVKVASVVPRAMWRGRGRGARLAQPWARLRSDSGREARAVGYINMIGLKQVAIALGLFGLTLGWSVRQMLLDRRAPRTVIVYNTLSYVAGPAWVAARLTRARLWFIVADVPLPLVGRPSPLVSLENWAQVRLIRLADALVTLSRLTAVELGRPDQPFVVVEGGYERDDVGAGRLTGPRRSGATRPPRTEAFRVVYAGSLNSVSGIDLLLDAVALMPTDRVRLDVFGDGDQSWLVEAAHDQRPHQVRYWGKVPHAEVLQALEEADLLVVPRRPDGFVTRYTFPSKVIEYLASGVPVLCNRLEGIDPSYDRFLNYPESDQPASWAEAITMVMQDPDSVEARAIEAKRFIETKKNWQAAVAPITVLLKAGSRHE